MIVCPNGKKCRQAAAGKSLAVICSLRESNDPSAEADLAGRKKKGSSQISAEPFMFSKMMDSYAPTSTRGVLG